MALRLLPCGPAAVVIEVESTREAIALGAWLREARPPGLVDLVPAARTVLAEFDSPRALADLEAALARFDGHDVVAPSGVLVTIETVYDGEDLPEAAERLGLSVAGVIEMHSSATYTVAFCGFVPEFAYLMADTPLLQLPRRPSPRPRVPRGSVAVAAGFAGVYPTASPGGWNLLGRTSALMWDASRPRPALAEPGDQVRFVPVTDA